MGLPPGPAVPKIALVAPSEGDYADLRVLVVSMGKFHRAVALTAAMCLAVATRLPGTVVHELTRPGDLVRIAHPAGVLPLAATSEKVVVYRTARRLMEGFVRVPASALSGADLRFRLSEADKLAPLLAAD
jgi:2-methylaconitate cis-trans-isomerase PrpF